MANRLQNVDLRGVVDMGNASNLAYKPNSITDAAISPTTEIDADKLQHIHKADTNFGADYGDTTPTARDRIVFAVSSANGGTVRAMHALLVGGASAGSETVKFDLKVNGSSILSSAVTFDSNDGTAKLVKDGTFSSTTINEDDVVSIEVAANGTPTTSGAYAWAEIEEGAT